MALQLYTKGKIFVFAEDGAGGLAAQAVSFSVSYDTNNNKVITLNDGFSGVTPGAGMTDVTIHSAVPRAGFEFNYHKWAAKRYIVELTGHRGSSSITVKGFIKSVGEEHGTDGTQATITIECGEPELS